MGDASRQRRGKAGPMCRWRVWLNCGLPREKGDVMGKEARIALLLGATACLLAVMVDWVVVELAEEEMHRH